MAPVCTVLEYATLVVSLPSVLIVRRQGRPGRRGEAVRASDPLTVPVSALGCVC